MKRWFSLLLVLALACMQLPAPVLTALSEAAVAIDAQADEIPGGLNEAEKEVSVEEEAPVGEESIELVEGGEIELTNGETADEMLDFELSDWMEDFADESFEEDSDDIFPETTCGVTAAQTIELPYSRVEGGEAPVYDEADDAEPFGWLADGAVVLTLGESEAGRARAAFAVEGGIVEGWLEAEALVPLDMDAIRAYMDAAALSGAAYAYDDDLNRLLTPVPCRWSGNEAPEDAPEADAEEPEAGEPEDAPESEASDDADEVEAVEDVPESEAAQDGEGENQPEGEEQPEADGEAEEEAEAPEEDAVAEPAEPAAESVVMETADAMLPGAPGITLACDSVRLGVEETYAITAFDADGAMLLPASLEYQVKGGAVTVNAYTGVVTAVRVGESTVTVLYGNDSSALTVTVTEAPSQVVCDENAMTLAVGQTVTPGCSVLDSNGDIMAASVTFTIDSETEDGCISLDADTGEIRALKAGTAVIRVSTYKSGVEATVKATVKKAVTGISIKPKFTAGTCMGVGQVLNNWKITLKPGGAHAPSVSFSSSNKKVLKVVDARSGKVKAMRAGTAYVTVKTYNYSTRKWIKSSRCKVVVRKAPRKIAISPAKGKLKVGTKGRYKVNLFGAGGSYTFKSSNTKVAVVSSNGTVRAVGAGKARITVRTYNGKKKTAYLRVVRKSYSGLPDYLMSNVTRYNNSLSNAEKLEYVIYVAQNKLGSPYVWGSFGPNRFDCSGFTYYCFSKIGIRMENSAYRQGYRRKYPFIRKISALRRGDLLCFNTVPDSDYCDHVGIYLGNGYFIHASSSAHKVVISQFKTSSTNYYKRNFSWGRRILK